MSLCLRTELGSATEAFAIQQGLYSLLNSRSDLLTLAALNDGAKPLIENKESSKQVLMDNLMFAVIVFLLLVVIFLCGKIFVIHKSLKDITKTFRKKLTADTNTLIDVSCTISMYVSLLPISMHNCPYYVPHGYVMSKVTQS